MVSTDDQQVAAQQRLRQRHFENISQWSINQARVEQDLQIRRGWLEVAALEELYCTIGLYSAECLVFCCIIRTAVDEYVCAHDKGLR